MARNDSHLSQGASAAPEETPVKMHHRMAIGEKVDGQRDPNGADKGDTKLRIGNNQGKTY